MSRIEDVENMMKTFRDAKKAVANKEKNIQEQAQEKQIEINKKNLHIERLEEQMAEIDPNGSYQDRMVLEEYNKELKRTMDEREKLITEKTEIENKNNKTLQQKREEQAEVNKANDEARKNLTMEKDKIEIDIKRNDIKMQSILLDMHEFKYEYELDQDGKEDRSKPVNGQEFKALNDQYEQLKTQNKELNEARDLCDKYLNELKQEYDKQVEEINKILRGEESKEESKEEPKVESKEEPKVESKEEPKVEPKEEPKVESKEEPKVESKEESKEEPKEESKEEPKEEPIVKPIVEPIVTQTSEPKRKQNIDIVISAKDNAVIINGEVNEKLNIGDVLENKNNMFKRLDINNIIKNELETKNIFKILNVRRKIDPVVVAAIDKSGNPKNEQVLKDYIYSLADKDMQRSEEGTDFSISYDLTDSKLEGSVDKQMQKYARHADKVNGIEVKGLKDKGPKAWFKAFMDKVKTIKLPKGRGEKEVKEESTGFKKMDEEAKRLKEENERNMKEEIKYRQGTMDRFVTSYENSKNEPEFDLKFFMQKASRELSDSELRELARVVHGEKQNGGFKAMDQEAKRLKGENDKELAEKYQTGDNDGER